MKIERVNGQVVKLDNTSYNTGDLMIHQDESKGTISIYLKNGPFSLPIVKDRKFSDFSNSAGDKFSTFALASAAVASAVAPGDGISSILSDKGTVTQLTNITTGVTLNVQNGIVTTVSSTLAADASANFTVTNNKVTATSNVIPNVIYAGAGNAEAKIYSISDGSFVVKLTNTGTAALNAAVKVGFIVL